MDPHFRAPHFHEAWGIFENKELVFKESSAFTPHLNIICDGSVL